jgi:hypothetical protein
VAAAVLIEAAGLAALAAITPTALLVSAVFLGSASPHRTVLIFLSGAIAMTAVMAAVVFVVLREGHLYKPHEHQPRYGIRLALGVLILAAGIYLLRRAKRRKQPSDPDRQKNGLVNRLIAQPGPKEAFIVGVIVYSPSLTFVAAVQTVATSSEPIGEDIAALVLVIVITLVLIWAPLLLFLFVPDRTGRLLAGFNSWLRSHGRMLLVAALLVGGVLLTIDGVLGLTGSA